MSNKIFLSLITKEESRMIFKEYIADYSKILPVGLGNWYTKRLIKKINTKKSAKATSFLLQLSMRTVLREIVEFVERENYEFTDIAQIDDMISVGSMGVMKYIFSNSGSLNVNTYEENIKKSVQKELNKCYK